MKRYTIGTKLMASVGAMALLATVISLCALVGMRKLEGRLSAATTTSTRKIELFGELNTATSDLIVFQRGMYLAAYEGDKAGVDTNKQGFHRAAATLRSSIAEAESLVQTEAGKRLTADLKERIDRWLAIFPELEQLCAAGNGAEAARIGREKTWSLYEETEKIALNLQKVQKGVLDEEREAGKRETALSNALVWLSMLVTAIVSVLVFVVIRKMTQQLRGITTEMSETAEQVSSAAGQVASASQTLAQGASEQAATVEETSASSEELTSMTRKNADSSRAAADLMSDVDGRVSEANSRLGDMVHSMQEINASSEKIAKIIKVIDEIAFQTNILALNAAVEAARAGDAGMGFAVVADEVRTLAQRSADAAKDTAQMIEESINRSVQGKVTLERVSQAIHAITEGAAKVKSLVDDVSNASTEQSRGIDQIGRALVQLEQVAQSSAATGEESAAASEELSAMAQSMRQTVTELEALVGRSK